MNWIAQAALGAALAGALALANRSMRPPDESRLWAAALAVAALIYVGFAAFGGAPAPWLLLELGGVILYAGLALSSLRLSGWLLALGWLAHVAWDTLVHGDAPGFVPGWYPAFCAGFDLIVATVIAARLAQRQRRTA